jgi:peptidoglycan-associated lipoprotein
MVDNLIFFFFSYCACIGFHTMKIRSALVRILLFSTLVSLGSSFGAQAWAEDISTRNANDTGFWLFGGVDFGYSHLSTSRPGEYDLSGTQVDAKLLISLYQEKFVYDAGLGWLYNSISGSSGSLSSGVNTRAAFAEFTPRYRLDNHWQIGPTVDFDFGGDMSLSTVAPNVDSTALLGGLQVNYEVNPQNSSWRWRVIARAENSIGLSNHSLLVTQIGLQIGLPFQSKPALVAEQPAPMAEASATVEAVEEKPVAQVTLGTEFIRFDTNSSTMKKKYSDFLKKIGKMLASNPEAWQRLQIAGHTDQRGSHELNLILSQRRAQAVRDALISGGAPAEKITSAGYSFDRPLDPANNEQAWTKNRRVEMNFMQASDPNTIQNGINKIKKSFH